MFEHLVCSSTILMFILDNGVIKFVLLQYISGFINQLATDIGHNIGNIVICITVKPAQRSIWNGNRHHRHCQQIEHDHYDSLFAAGTF